MNYKKTVLPFVTQDMVKVYPVQMESVILPISKTPYLLCDSEFVNPLIPLLWGEIGFGILVFMKFLIVKAVTGDNLLPGIVFKIPE